MNPRKGPDSTRGMGEIERQQAAGEFAIGRLVSARRSAAGAGRARGVAITWRMARNELDIRPLSGAVGAEIFGVDLAQELDDDTVAAIRRAWLDHLVIFFRDQNLPPAKLLGLARHFGQPIEYPFVTGIDGFPEIPPVIKLERERVNFGGLWHSDTTYLEQPPMGTMLVAREVPPYGGGTLVANV